VAKLVGEDGGLIAGHARILAARQLGIAEIPVMVAAGWSEAQKRAYVLADNQLAITGKRRLTWPNGAIATTYSAEGLFAFSVGMRGPRRGVDELSAVDAQEHSGTPGRAQAQATSRGAYRDSH
jgi:hypothetical protein